MKFPKIVFTDIDGVWTDGGMYYSDCGCELKKFNTSDSFGVMILNYFNIPLYIITGESNKTVISRAKKLGIKNIVLGVKNKLKTVEDILKVKKISLKESAFIGDDIGDFELIKNIGFSACPSQSPLFIKEIVDYVTEKKGGEGAFREFILELINRSNLDEKELIKNLLKK